MGFKNLRLLGCSSFLLFGLCISLSGFARTDSLAVVNAKWESKKIAPKIRLKQCWFKDSSLFKSNQVLSVLEVKRSRRHEIDLAYETKLLKKTSEFGSQTQAIAAINAGFFNMKEGGSVDFIRSNGLIVATNAYQKNGKRAIHQTAALLIKNNRVDVVKWDGTKDWEERLDGEDVLVSGPALMVDGKTERLDSIPHNTYRHPRSAIAVKGKNRVLFIVVDGRNANSSGMSLFELTKVLKWMGCYEGISLDGGGSSALWVNGMPENGIVSYPSDNKKWDHAGERKVANVLIVKKRRRQ